MLNRTILTLLFLSLCQAALAITIINQTDSVKILEIEEAYRPAPDKPGNLAAPIALGYPPQKIKIAPHSSKAIPLKTTPKVLLITTITTTRKERKTTTSKQTTCYEPYSFQNQPGECFDDAWGLVIHKPIVGQTLSPFDPDYIFKQWNLEQVKKQGYGIKCLHPLLLTKVTSVEDLPQELKSDIGNATTMSLKRS